MGHNQDIRAALDGEIWYVPAWRQCHMALVLRAAGSARLGGSQSSWTPAGLGESRFISKSMRRGEGGSIL